MVGRKKEIKELERLYNSNKAELVAIYGRRRVGKTYLVSNEFKGKFFFRHSGLSPEEDGNNGRLRKQLIHFYESLIDYGMENIDVPKDWFEAFSILKKFIRNNDTGNRIVIFFDELPWMASKGSDFIQAFEGFWNSFGSTYDNLMIIVCGSATSWMENNLINNQGGLYGRVTYEIKLKPFTLFETKEFLTSNNSYYSNYDITLTYMIFGGIPYYLNYIDNEKIIISKYRFTIF